MVSTVINQGQSLYATVAAANEFHRLITFNLPSLQVHLSSNGLKLKIDFFFKIKNVSNVFEGRLLKKAAISSPHTIRRDRVIHLFSITVMKDLNGTVSKKE